MNENEPSFGPETQEALLNRLRKTRTQDGRDCALFCLSEKKEEVRMSTESLVKYAKSGLPQENTKTHRELCEMIIKLAEEEKNNSGTLDSQKKLEATLDQFFNEVVLQIHKLRDEAKEQISQMNEKTYKFSSFLKQISSPDFEEKLDELIAEFETEKKRPDAKIQQILEQLNKTQVEINEKMKGFREKIQSYSHIKATMGSLENFLFDHFSIQEAQVLNGDICTGVRGIATHFRQREMLLVLMSDGELRVFNSKENKMVQSFKTSMTTSRSFLHSVSFNVSGELVSVSNYFDCTIDIYKVEHGLLTKSTRFERSRTGKHIYQAKWYNSTQLLASFSYPGVIEVLEIRSNTPVMTLAPENISKGSYIADFCFPSTNGKVIGASFEESLGQTFLFKMDMGYNAKRFNWVHHAHIRPINSVATTSCGLYVLSGGMDDTLILTRESDGVVLKKESSFFSKSILGVIVFPKSSLILVETWKELVLIRLNKDSQNFEKKDQITISQLNEKDFTSFSVTTNPKRPNEYRIYCGLERGSLFQAALRA